jgi:hypothetical protein
MPKKVKVGIRFLSGQQPKSFICPLKCEKFDKDGDPTGNFEKFTTMSTFLTHMRTHDKNGVMSSICLIMELNVEDGHTFPDYFKVVNDFNMDDVNSPNFVKKTTAGGGESAPIVGGGSATDVGGGSATDVGGGSAVDDVGGVAQSALVPENLETKFAEMDLAGPKAGGGGPVFINHSTESPVTTKEIIDTTTPCVASLVLKIEKESKA